MANPYLNDAFFEAMRRQLRDQVEGQRRRASRGASRDLDRRGLFGESTVAAQAHAGIGGESTRAIGEGETAIEGMEFKRDLEKFLLEESKPSFLEQALPVLGQGVGAIAGFALGGPPGAALGAGLGRGVTGGSGASGQVGEGIIPRSPRDPFDILGQGKSTQRDYLGEAQARYKARKKETYSQAANALGRYQ